MLHLFWSLYFRVCDFGLGTYECLKLSHHLTGMFLIFSLQPHLDH